MQKIKLNKNIGKLEIAHGYVLDPKTEYIITMMERSRKLNSE